MAEASAGCLRKMSKQHSQETISDMAMLQQLFMKKRSRTVLGRENNVKVIKDYIITNDKDVPLVILGGAGSGKSSLMCKAVDIISNLVNRNSLPSSGDGNWKLFYHFVGAVPGSTDLEATLKRLLIELGICNESDMPKDIQTACQMCCNTLSNPKTPPTIIFMDSLNQYPEDLPATVLSWLPRKLASQIRCVLSMIDNTLPHHTLMSRETKAQGVMITPLDQQTRKEIVKETLGKYSKALRPGQLHRLVSKQSSETPLWLVLCCEEINALKDFTLVDDKIDSFPEGILELLKQVLDRFECDKKCGDLVTATLCLLEAASAGLLKSELLAIMGQDTNLLPPSPYDEKDEKESSEKEKAKCLPVEKWSLVYRLLEPFLRPYGNRDDGRIDFYHRAMSKAVRAKYFFSDKEPDSEVRQAAHTWWHTKLADYFENVENVGRRVEEYPYQLAQIEDTARLSRCLCEWSVVDTLYHEEYSSQLMKYWRKAGGSDVMMRCYINKLSDLEVNGATEETIAHRHEQVARIFIQAGKYTEALEFARTALKMEEQDLGGRPERMAELYGLVADIYDERLKLHDFVSVQQLPDLDKALTYSRKSISIRNTLLGDHHRFKLAMTLMRMSFNMESWESLTRQEGALQIGLDAIDNALQIFDELNDRGHYAEALMTKGVLAPRGSVEQLKYYNEAMEISQQLYGEYHLLTSRLYINIGITHEDNKNYNKAYDYFKKWAHVSEVVLGPDHPKTKRAKGVLKESRYRRIARRLGEATEQDNDESSDNREDSDDQESDGDGNNEADNESHGIGLDMLSLDENVLTNAYEVLQQISSQLNEWSGTNNLSVGSDINIGDNVSSDTNIGNNGIEGDLLSDSNNISHSGDLEGEFADNQAIDLNDAASDHHGNSDIEDAIRDNREIEDHVIDDVSNNAILHHNDQNLIGVIEVNNDVDNVQDHVQ